MGFSLNMWNWQERRDLNPQLTVLETVALPIELLSYEFWTKIYEKNSEAEGPYWALGEKL